jgi:uncharacterized protein YidB (DUF937 family)
MGLLDEVMSMAGVGAAQQDQHCTALTAIMNYVNSPQVGGIAGLQKMFQQGGLGSVMSSWIGTGQNTPVSADQLQNATDRDDGNVAAASGGQADAEWTDPGIQHVAKHDEGPFGRASLTRSTSSVGSD